MTHDTNNKKFGRVERENEDYSIAYGLDHACGLFIQVYDKSKANDDDEGLILDIDQWTDDSLTLEKIVAIADDYNFDLRYEVEESIVE